MTSLVRCVLGPRLYRVHAHETIRGHDYQPNALEKHSDNIIKLISFCWSFGYYTSPLILTFLYRRGYFTQEGALGLGKLGGMVLLTLFGAYYIRGLGRMNNPEYVAFINLLDEVTQNSESEKRKMLQLYDFDFSAWPVDYEWSTSSSQPLWKNQSTAVSQRGRGITSWLGGLPCQLLSYLAIHTFGSRMVYPGRTSLLNAAVWAQLLLGRTKLIEKDHGIRAKLRTRDGNSIDTMFVDRRLRSDYPNGQKLVITSEGNAGFYEIGCMETPLKAGYSVLGWNHPGFGGSTGAPYPHSEGNAIAVVMQYAVEELGFSYDDISLFAWSIGGFAASWAAMNYPDLSSVTVDATFDDLVPLAIAKMPDSMANFVSSTLRTYMNMKIAENLCNYTGPLRIIRRTKDEIITTSEIPEVPCNRGNDLLIKILQSRYPNLLTEEVTQILRQFLGISDHLNMLSMYSAFEVEDSACLRTLKEYADKHSTKFPMLIGEDLPHAKKVQLTLFLTTKYMTDFDSTHCTPLPPSYFLPPWSLDDEMK
ncbi:phosphatidylserine lipase ABHD16A-like [Diadema setosum]|uniref:phosphatidylserine lipase ABHD16A-like n=1 Tax=Diadema setosum TaxID=31175 RepID=UPI003B39FF8D